MPPSATMQPTARPGTPPATPANVAPTGTPGTLHTAATHRDAAGQAAPSQHAAGSRRPWRSTVPPAGAGPLPGGRPGLPTATAPGAPRRPIRGACRHDDCCSRHHAAGPSRYANRRRAGDCAHGANPAALPGQPPKPPVAQAPPGTGPGTMASPRPASRLVRRLLPARLRAQLDDRSRRRPRRRASRSGRSISRPLLPPRPPGRRRHHRGLGRGAADAPPPPRIAPPPPARVAPPVAVAPARAAATWRDPRRRRRSPGRRHRRRPGWPSRHRRRARQHLRRVLRPRRRRQRSARRTSPDARQVLGRAWSLRKGASRGRKPPAKGPYFLASGRNRAIHRAISHGNMAHKAVRWQPGPTRLRLLTRFRRNQPEN